MRQSRQEAIEDIKRQMIELQSALDEIQGPPIETTAKPQIGSESKLIREPRKSLFRSKIFACFFAVWIFGWLFVTFESAKSRREFDHLETYFPFLVTSAAVGSVIFVFDKARGR